VNQQNARRRTLLATASLACALASPAFAQEPVTETRVDEIVVTAAGFEQRVEQAPASITVIPRREIEEIRAVSIAEILGNVEGVDVGAAVGKTGGQTINIRGMGSD
jgi:outer membrane receptor for ferrienterochelin and colicins